MIIEIIDGALFKKALTAAATLLETNKEEINSLNVFPVPDGDTGTNMSLTMKSALKQGMAIEDDNCYKIALATSQGSLMGARGNSGVILSQLFRGFANALKGKATIDTITLSEALKQASETAYKAVMKPTEGTILTVARECGEFAYSIRREEKDILQFLIKIIDHGNKILDKTPEMLPVLKQAGVVDAGGKGFMYILQGVYNGLSGIEPFVPITVEPAITVKEHHREPIDTDNIEFGYCTEFMINSSYNEIDSFREELSIQGDSLMVVGGEGLIKVHIHTNNPGDVLQKALSLGELTDIKIDNMRYQHEEVLLREELKLERLKKEELKGEADNSVVITDLNKEYSFVSVSIGEGIDDVFKSLNVDFIVPGGQTMNPSTEDILRAVENTSGKNVIILPNNGNIILAAEQVKYVSSRTVHVLNTKSIPEGISAILAFDEDLTLEENLENMEEAIKTVLTGQITYAVRDTEFNNTKINKDDIIGLYHGDIVSTGTDINEVTLELIADMVNDDISIITIFYGTDVTPENTEELVCELEEKYSDIDIDLIYGGQPLYYYIFSLE